MSAAGRPLSFAQQQLWLLDRIRPGSAAYNVTSAFHLEGALDEAAFGRALDAIVARHEALRTTFHEAGEEPAQVVGPPRPVELERVDLSALPADLREAALARCLREAARRPFDLSRDLMLRGALVRLGEREHVVLLVLHHIACDGWSLRVLARELEAHYQAARRGGVADLPPLPTQYGDHAAWQRTWLAGPHLDAEIAFWRERLAGAPPALALPADRPRPTVLGDGGAHCVRLVPSRLVGAVKALARTERATLFAALLAAFQSLLHRYTGETDLVIGTASACRTRRELEPLIGYFVNTLPLRMDLRGAPTFRELLRQARQVASEALGHQELPFERLVAALAPERRLDRSPLLQVDAGAPRRPEFALSPPGRPRHHSRSREHGDGQVRSLALRDGEPAGWTPSPNTAPTSSTRRPSSGCSSTSRGCSRARSPIPTGGSRRCRSSPGRSRRGSPRGAARRPPRRARNVSTTSSRRGPRSIRRRSRSCPPRARSPIASSRRARRARALPATARCGARRAGRRVHGAVARSPARALRGPQGRRGLSAPRPRAAPGAPALHARRHRRRGRDRRRGSRRRGWRGSASASSALDRDADEIARAAGESLEPDAEPGDLAYILYTSGSTGRPKGVMIPHRAIANHMRWMAEALPLSGADAVLQRTPIGFDASVWEFWAPLIAGARLVMAPPGAHRDPAVLARVLAEQGITVVQVVPSLLRALLDEPASRGRRRSGACAAAARPSARSWSSAASRAFPRS